MENVYLKKAKEKSAQLSEWRRNLHQIPELGLELPETTAYLEKELEQMGIQYRRLENGAGIVAEIGQGERTFLLRSDMDGLPIREESGESFASSNGCMHACGHDMHAAILLGAADILREEEKNLKGKVRLLFQSGEETFEGAKEAVRQNVLEGVDGAFAMHVASTVPVGWMIYGEHPMSSSTIFTITLNGIGGHGSMPEACVDPIFAGVQVYQAFQELIARECAAADEVVLTFGSFQAGTAANVIPQQAVLQGTLRTFREETRNYIVRRMEEILNGIDAVCRVSHQFEITGDSRDVVCDRELMEQCVESIRSLSDDLVLKPLFHVMGSEDFACISHQVPSCYIGIGAAADRLENCVGQHNPKVRFHEDCLAVGAAAYAQIAVDFLKKKAEKTNT